MKRFRLALAVAALALVLLPMVWERTQFLQVNAALGRANLRAFTEYDPGPTTPENAPVLPIVPEPVTVPTRLLPRNIADGEYFQQMLKELDRLQAVAPGRVYAGKGGDWGSKFKVGEVPVYAALTMHGLPTAGFLYHGMGASSDLMYSLQEPRGDLGTFGVRWLVAPSGNATFPLHRAFGRFSIYSIVDGGFWALGTVPYKVEGTEVFDTSAAWMASGMPHQGEYIGLAGELPANAATLHAGDNALKPTVRTLGAVWGETRHGETYTARVHVDQATAVVFRSSYHPNLRATVDGHPATGFMVTPGYLAFSVPAGDHQVHVIYESANLGGALGRLGSFAALIELMLAKVVTL